jgi:hypothetical protein
MPHHAHSLVLFIPIILSDPLIDIHLLLYRWRR